MKILEFLTIKDQKGPKTIKIKGSKFISYAIPADSHEAIQTQFSIFKKQYYDSTHICSAYRLVLRDQEYYRYNDDGEPSQTAGSPIFNAIKSFNYFNVLVLVIRYYGGTKLGTGGLTQAYRESAREVLQDTIPLTISKKSTYKISVTYNLTGDIMNICKKNSLKILDRIYSKDGISLIIEIPTKDSSKITELHKNPKLNIIPLD